MVVLCILVFLALIGLGAVLICLISIAVSLMQIRAALQPEDDGPGTPDPDDGEKVPGFEGRSWPRAA